MLGAHRGFPTDTGDRYIESLGLAINWAIIGDEVAFKQKGNRTDPMGSLFSAVPEDDVRYHFEAGHAYPIRVKTVPPTKVDLKIFEERSEDRN